MYCKDKDMMILGNILVVDFFFNDFAFGIFITEFQITFLFLNPPVGLMVGCAWEVFLI